MKRVLGSVMLLALMAVPPGYAQVSRDPNTGATSTGPWSGSTRTSQPGNPFYRPTPTPQPPEATPTPWHPLATPTPRPRPTYRKYERVTPMPTPTPWRVPTVHAAASVMPAGWAWRNPGPSLRARHGAVACVNGEASRVGVQIMAHGGNAVDAAIATALALAVVYPVAGNLGGGGFMMIRTANGSVAALDFRETAPARATRTMYLDASGNLTEKSRVGALAVGVPGTVAGLEAAHKRFGRLPWAQLVAPAIALARNGFVVNANLAESFHTAQDTLMRFAETRRVLMPEEHLPLEGDRLVQPDLARTLQAIASQGARGFYRGWVARAIAADQSANGGLITTADLAHYQARWRTPVSFTYRGNRIYSMPPPSSGGVALAEILNILEGSNQVALGWHTPRQLHWLADAQRLAFADRNAYLGDPDFVPNQPVARLISKAYAAQRRALIRPDRAVPTQLLKPGLHEKEQTTHFSVVDAAGNAVSCTYTLNGLFGSGMVAKGTGVVLNDEMDDFAAKPGKANMFGLVQGDKNAIAPGKRPLSSMAPAIMLDPTGRLSLVIGSPGGPTIITTVQQVIQNMVDFHLPLNVAIAAPRFHAQDHPEFLFHEKGGLLLETRVALVHMGYQTHERVWIGDAQGVYRRPDGWLEAFSDPRHGGQAAGY